jgi:hypothetical protein
VHPSEYAKFDKIPEYDPVTPPRRRGPLATVVILVALTMVALGAVMLFERSSTPPVTSSLRNIAARLDQLPGYAQTAAKSAIELVITDDGHLTWAPAMVITPGNLAVTTYPIPAGASLTGTSQLDANFSASVVSSDTPLGFTIVKLGETQPVTPTDVLPASAAVLAIAPYFSAQAAAPEIAWANTTLGDPIIEQADGVVSYLATPSDPNLGDFADALAVLPNGGVAAVLAANGEWYSAQYITRVAHVVSEDGGCHGRLGVVANTAQGGGVVVVRVPRGPSLDTLRPGDVLTSIDGEQLESIDTLLEYLYAAPARQVVHLSLLRHGRPVSVAVVLGCEP